MVAALLVAACASSTGGAPPDAEPEVPDAVVVDAMAPDAAPPDAVPCFPDPDGETCNGSDDDCDGNTDEGYPGVGEDCAVGIGTCSTAGSTICTEDGLSTVCDAVAGTPGAELCGSTFDEDCDMTVDEGFPDLGDVCSVGAGLCLRSGVFVCTGDGLGTTCNAVPGTGMVETCDGMDNDCDGFFDEGFQISQSCDGPGDGDMCMEGVWACDGVGGRTCTDTSTTTYDLCGNGDEDCDPTSGDGSEDGTVGLTCDGAGVGQDSDLCAEGVTQCVSGALYCNDNTASTVDLCGGGNEDCDATSVDGSEDPAVGATCDGGDSDLCTTGVSSCVSGALSCSDDAASTLDLCGNGDEDCDGASADGSEQSGFGTSCDGASDSDLCTTGSNVCSGTSLVCNDDATSTFDLCGNGDEDCDATSADGSEHAGFGAVCDSLVDTDLCTTGSNVCSGTALVCNDDVVSTVDLCGNGDEDCDLASADGSEQSGYGVSCDSGDSDLCFTGNNVCSGTSMVCNDDATSLLDLCGNGDEDCDGTSGDGTEQTGYGVACDTASDSDLCLGGTNVCSGTVLACNDDATSILDLCGNGNEDCDGASNDGTEHPGFGTACDSTVDTDLCATGTNVCVGTALSCDDDANSLIELCNGVNDDCNSATSDAADDLTIGQACDGTNDTDFCLEGSRGCSGGGYTCSDSTGSTIELCAGNAADENCNTQVDEGFTLNDNTACSSSTLPQIGTVSGDSGANVVQTTNYNEEWYWLRVTEDNSDIGGLYLSATVQLINPAGVDFDLYAYCFNCGGSLAGSSTLGDATLAAHTDTINLRGDDDTPFPLGEDDDHWILLEVRYWSSDRCANYTLRVTGNTAVSTNTCNI